MKCILTLSKVGGKQFHHARFAITSAALELVADANDADA
jgi:hypothetical protein